MIPAARFAGMIMGMPYITWAHDFEQGLTSGPDSVGTGSQDGGLGFSFVDPEGGWTKNFVGVGGGLEPIADARITHAMSQSIPEPATGCLMVLVAVILCARRRRRRRASP